MLGFRRLKQALLVAMLLTFSLCCPVQASLQSANRAAALSSFQALHGSSQWVAVCGDEAWWLPTACVAPGQVTSTFDANGMLPRASPSSDKCANIIRCPGEVYSVSVTFWAGKYRGTPVYYATGVAQQRFGTPGGLGIGVAQAPRSVWACWYRWGSGSDGCACVCASILRAAPDGFQGCSCGMP